MLLYAIVVLMLPSLTCGKNPAIQVILNDKGLQYGKHAGTDWIQRNLKKVTLPEIGGSILGIDYTLSGIKIAKCDLPEPSVKLYPGATGVKTSMSGLSVALTGDWTTHLGIIHDGGTFDMAMFSVNVISVVELGKDTNGHLSVSSVSCDAQVGDVDIEFHGGASWLFQPFVDFFKGHISSIIQSNICPNVENMISNLEHHLQAMNVSIDVDQALTLDLSLTGLPIIDVSSLNLGLKGEFYSIKTHAEPPFEAQPFKLSEQQGYMLSLGLSEFTLNSASYGYYSAGIFKVLINDSMIPPFSPVHLNTSSMGRFIPQLPQMFPGLLMELQVYAREVPMFSIQPAAVRLGFQGAIKAFAIQRNGTKTPLFKLNADSKFSSKVWISNGKLTGSASMDNFTLTLVASEIGTFKTDSLEKIVKLGIKTVGLEKLNEKLKKGVDLPRMKHAQLVNSVLKVGVGFIALFSDAKVLLSDRGSNQQTNGPV
ncbi:lipopolysaccharide-binding protein [Toxotes jaculatrix]|uniref:lipopolysaccharide-binding protein n=1 Tax=Toxotes jaculatrix TaxID=941984 RepID=UPI001B3A86AB|nr:lipopolysaccharide-binding protein [Toxotes jaculatrix]XP_040905571.1 lipopolysaccharide-binding protein [Toxotes jaculatrix]XP_040905579.1 lipopolysaccharide-binding protein [Toxotes jaculatrix]XP_040905589.1 lipopolysaccharide-binding protein [Toxotes jaculatrix]XP_040905598.1 lipopolysaccharide-binding protein [Toxotes jaculatrix]